MEPFISIVIPLYNKEKCIIHTIQNIISQSYRNFEVIVVNDGSTDKSAQIVSSIDDKRIKLFNKKNEGVSTARNFGVAKSTSDWIFFIDADDNLHKDGLSVFVKLINDFPESQFFTANYYAKYSDGKEVLCCNEKGRGKVRQAYKKVWERKVFPRMGNMLISKKCFIDAGQFIEHCSIWEDLELVLKLLNKNDLIFDPTPIFTHNLDNNELSQKIKPIESEFAFYINLANCTNYYEKLICLELLARTKNKRNEIGDTSAVELMSDKIGANFVVLFYGKCCRYLRKHLA